MLQCLYTNKNLTSLNLANNFMDEECGRIFEEATRYNTTLIDFEFMFNNFHIEHVSYCIVYNHQIDKEVTTKLKKK